MYLEPIQEVLTKENKTKPTLIQKSTYEAITSGASVVGLAKTGTGKTLAYGLPVIERISEIGGLAIILEPTTELAVQTRDALLAYVKAMGLKVLALVGAGNRKRQLERLRKEKPQILVCTPGRFFDFLSDNRIKVDQITSLVIDEADDILEFAKVDMLSSLGQNLEPQAQILLFGASESTITRNCEELFAHIFLLIDVRPDQKSNVKHGFLQVSNQYKMQFLQRLTKLDNFKGILFFDSTETEMKFARIFAHSKTKFSVLSSQANKQERERIMSQFKAGKSKLLFATDLAARGLDIPDVTYVINFEIPSEVNTYMHRSGRTGRMNKEGQVITLGDDHDFRDLRKLLADSYQIERVYFAGYHLTNERPKKAKNDDSSSQKQIVTKPEAKHKKKRWRNKKNKGYHPHKRRKEGK
ncbi:superfamily II DNA/RNA helicase [Lactobacillus colini]|uniref:Superfamily II DNA/RNA helicase n=1 Tax=Lactobacillus colini TaxID=1819254 RepID=A0ABS4MD18_9LACO|nr:DEAD/DEAH box helicase [Lactobacillus colini]MBP2057578.1 superfamily II DNA/RNA helicase [Lactobacillus colini]